MTGRPSLVFLLQDLCQVGIVAAWLCAVSFDFALIKQMRGACWDLVKVLVLFSIHPRYLSGKQDTALTSIVNVLMSNKDGHAEIILTNSGVLVLP